MSSHLSSALVLLSLLQPWMTAGDTSQEPAKQQAPLKNAPATLDESAEEQRRIFAISLITSLADEAKSYKDGDVRTNVLARAADALWDADHDASRALFRRAWDSAEVSYAEKLAAKTENQRLARIMSIMQSVHGDLRSEVLRLAARRDNALAEEFIQKLEETTKGETKDREVEANLQNLRDNWAGQKSSLARFAVARRLLEDGEVDRALEIVSPVLDQVNANSISFLSLLREKRPDLADQRFRIMLDRAEADPIADANTASGLSSYLFSPSLYVTFSSDGNPSWGQMSGGRLTPPNVSPALRDAFFRTAASILLRPSPSTDEDHTSAGRTGKYLIMRRLIPLFDQFATDLAAALKAQMTSLEPGLPKNATNEDSVGLKLTKQGITPNESPGTILQKLQDRLDRARTSQERDQILEEVAFALTDALDVRARTVADRIENKDRRIEIRSYIDLEFLREAAQKKDLTEVIRITKTGELIRLARVWGYTRAAQLLMNTKRFEAFELLEEAASEARRIAAEDSDRARGLVSVATNFATADKVRAWEVANEAVKAANAAEKFSGEDTKILVRVMTRTGFKTRSVAADDFALAGMLQALAKDDLYRSVELAKGFQNPTPRAVAILAVANSVLVRR